MSKRTSETPGKKTSQREFIPKWILQQTHKAVSAIKFFLIVLTYHERTGGLVVHGKCWLCRELGCLLFRILPDKIDSLMLRECVVVLYASDYTTFVKWYFSSFWWKCLGMGTSGRVLFGRSFLASLFSWKWRLLTPRQLRMKNEWKTYQFSINTSWAFGLIRIAVRCCLSTVSSV